MALACRRLPWPAVADWSSPGLAGACRGWPGLAVACHGLPRLAMAGCCWLAVAGFGWPWLAGTDCGWRWPTVAVRCGCSWLSGLWQVGAGSCSLWLCVGSSGLLWLIVAGCSWLRLAVTVCGCMHCNMAQQMMISVSGRCVVCSQLFYKPRSSKQTICH